jgi:hypothetical protein
MTDNPQLFKRLSDSDSLTDVLIQMEDFMDSLDLYVFKNWFEGQIVQGPDIRRYWVSMTLKYLYEEMPDPAGAERLIKHGVKVIYRKAKDSQPKETDTMDDLLSNNKPKMEDLDVWLVEIQIPRRFIEELDDSDLELHADDELVDPEDVSDARDENIDDEDAFTDDNGEPGDDAQEADADADEDADKGGL